MTNYWHIYLEKWGHCRHEKAHRQGPQRSDKIHNSVTFICTSSAVIIGNGNIHLVRIDLGVLSIFLTPTKLFFDGMGRFLAFTTRLYNNDVDLPNSLAISSSNIPSSFQAQIRILDSQPFDLMLFCARSNFAKSGVFDKCLCGFFCSAVGTIRNGMTTSGCGPVKVWLMTLKYPPPHLLPLRLKNHQSFALIFQTRALSLADTVQFMRTEVFSVRWSYKNPGEKCKILRGFLLLITQ